MDEKLENTTASVSEFAKIDKTSETASANALEDLNEPLGEEVKKLATSISLGDRLRQAREQQNMSREQVVGQLKIPMKWLIAIEENHWHEFPNPTYIRSYLRNYAKMVSMNIEVDINQTFPMVNITQEAIRNIVPISPRLVVVENKFVFRQRIWAFLVAVLMVVVLAIVVYRWGGNNMNVIGAIPTPSTGKATNSTLEHPLILPSQITSTLSEKSELFSSSRPSSIDRATMESISSTVIVVPPASMVNVESSTPASTKPSSVLITKDNPSIQSTPPHTLILKAKNRSWIQIKTSTDAVLLERFLQSGEALSYTVKKPFFLVVGNASEVEASYDGKALTLDRMLTENGNARLQMR